MPSDALVLGFDTSAAHCAAALVQGDTLLAQLHNDMARGQAEALMPLLEQVLAQAGKGWGDLDGLAVGVGPGNFTGIRIAVSAARGLSLGLNVPAIGVSIFDARAEGLPRPLCVVEDARRDEVYVQEFTAGAGTAQLLPLHECAALTGGHALTGSAATALGAMTRAQVLEPRFTLAHAITRVGLRRLGQDKTRPAPLYIRPADAAPSAQPPVAILP